VGAEQGLLAFAATRTITQAAGGYRVGCRAMRAYYVLIVGHKF
jgi:hypothetical protein